MYLIWKLKTKPFLLILCHYCKDPFWSQLQLEMHVPFWEIIFWQKRQNYENSPCTDLPISLLSDKIQKRSISHLKTLNQNIFIYFVQFLQKITLKAATTESVCIIFSWQFLVQLDTTFIPNIISTYL